MFAAVFRDGQVVTDRLVYYDAGYSVSLAISDLVGDAIAIERRIRDDVTTFLSETEPPAAGHGVRSCRGAEIAAIVPLGKTRE